MLRRLASAMAALGMLVLLSGCLKVDMTLEISEDDTVSGTMVTAMNKQALSTMGPFVGASGGSPREIWDAMQEETNSDLPDGATVEPYDEGDFIGDKITFDEVPLEEMGGAMDSGETGAFSITHEGDTYVFRGAFDLSGQASGGGVSESEMQGFFALYGKPEMKTVLTFPGEVVETNGEVEGTQVTWTRDLSSTTQEPMTAVAKDTGGAVKVTDGTGDDDTSSEASGRAGSDDDASALAISGVGLGSLVILIALVGMSMGVSRSLRG